MHSVLAEQPTPAPHHHFVELATSSILTALMLTHDLQDNDDYCSSCGGNGELVCCDGCTRSFHYICTDPPIDKDQNLPDEWFCNVCNFKDINKNSEKYFRSDKPNAFDVLLSKVHRRNPQSFGLPKDVRDRFENVKTGADGEYEEVIPPKPK